jgi:hypothetical protein
VWLVCDELVGLAEHVKNKRQTSDAQKGKGKIRSEKVTSDLSQNQLRSDAMP